MSQNIAEEYIYCYSAPHSKLGVYFLPLTQKLLGLQQ